MRFGMLVAIMVLIVIFPGCSSSDWLISDLSPDGKANAVLFRTDSGAWAPFSYELYILTDAHPKAVEENIILSVSGLRCVSLKWNDSTTISVTYLAAHTNFVKTAIPGGKITLLISEDSNCGNVGSDRNAVIYAPRSN
jgi:hypothetical protein